MLNPIYLDCTTLPDAWFQTVYKCLEVGREFTIDRGSYAGQLRLEFDYITIRIRQPWVYPLLPRIPEQYNIPDPVSQDYLDQYLPYLMTSEKVEGESYTYGERLNKYKLLNGETSKRNFKQFKDIFIQEEDAYIKSIINESGNSFLSQVELLIWTFKNKGHRNNQMCLQVAQPSDMLLQDPPCLRLIDVRIQDNTLHFFPYFRSWDLFGGFPANLAAIELMKQYIADEIGIDNGEIIASSKGLHLYSYTWELAEIIRGKTIKEFREGI